MVLRRDTIDTYDAGSWGSKEASDLNTKYELSKLYPKLMLSCPSLFIIED